MTVLQPFLSQLTASIIDLLSIVQNLCVPDNEIADVIREFSSHEFIIKSAGRREERRERESLC